MSLIEDAKGWTRKNGAPFTVLLVVSFIVTSLILWSTHFAGADKILLSNVGPTHIWAFLTYPWAYMPLADGLSLMFFVFLMFWLIQAGMSIEREIGTLRMAGLWFGMTLLAGLVMFSGASILNIKLGLGAPYLPESAITIVWCVRNRTTTIMLYGFIPATGFWLGWATVVINVLLFGAGAPALGVLSVVHLAVAYFYAADRIPFLPYAASGGRAQMGRRIKINEKEATTRGQVRYDQTYFDEVKRRETERAEQDRLKKLFGDDK